MPAPTARTATPTSQTIAGLDETAHVVVDGVTPVGPAGFGPGGHRPPPPVLGDTYQLAEVLGSGGTSRVYRGRHLVLGIPVAVKVFAVPDPAAADEVARQARSEAVTLAGLNHPGIVRLWDFGVADGAPYLVTEYVAGGTLADEIRRAGRLEWAPALRVGRAVAAALAAAAREGVIHRDVKPGNILLPAPDAVKLIDFGLAVVRGGRALYRTPSSRRAALAGTGTYMAPEQVLETDRVDHRTDMYSLGATLYHAVTGRPPFAAAAVHQVLLRHVREVPPPPHLVAPGMSLAASALIARLLAKRQGERFATYDELISAIDRLIAA